MSRSEGKVGCFNWLQFSEPTVDMTAKSLCGHYLTGRSIPEFDHVSHKKSWKLWQFEQVSHKKHQNSAQEILERQQKICNMSENNSATNFSVYALARKCYISKYMFLECNS